MITIVNTLVENEFQKFICNAMENRDKYIIMQNKMRVNATPEFHDLFLNSKFMPSKTTCQY